MSHNKTLAAQLYSEFKEFFPHNAVHYFVSYYDYYQPEAYIPQRDIYIEKDASINQEIDRLRLAATSALVSRRDVIIVASVSCIYGLGSPEDYRSMMVGLARGPGRSTATRCSRKLVDIQYERNDIEFEPGKFRVRGDCVEVWPSYEEFAFRIEFWGDEVEQLSIINPTSGEVIQRQQELFIYPAKHFVLPEERIAAGRRRDPARSCDERLEQFKRAGQAAGGPAAQRPHAVRHRDAAGGGLLPGDRELQPAAVAAAPPGSPPDTLFSFFPDDFLLFVDESHVTVPQIRGMYAGDHNRKVTLVEHGFRLPSALDNRPLQFDEWEKRIKQVIFVSATPGPLRAGADRRRGGRAGDPAHRPAGPGDRGGPGPRPGAAPAGADPPAGGRRRAGAGHHAHQAAGRGPGRLLQQAGRPLQVAAQRAGRLRAGRAAARPAPGAVRRAGGREPAPRRARPARGLAGGDPRRRQGGLPAERDLADADHRPLRPQRQRQGACSTPTR